MNTLHIRVGKLEDENNTLKKDKDNMREELSEAEKQIIGLSNENSLNKKKIDVMATDIVNLGKPSEKKYCKKRDIVPLSNDPYHPPCKRDILIRDKIDLICPPTLLIELVTFLQKKLFFQTYSQ